MDGKQFSRPHYGWSVTRRLAMANDEWKTPLRGGAARLQPGEVAAPKSFPRARRTSSRCDFGVAELVQSFDGQRNSPDVLTTSATVPLRSLVSQGFDRVHACGADRGIEPADQTDGDGNQNRDRNRFVNDRRLGLADRIG